MTDVMDSNYGTAREPIGSTGPQMGTRWQEIVENLYPFQATHLIFRAEDLPRRSERLVGEVGEKKERNGAGDACDRENRVLAI